MASGVLGISLENRHKASSGMEDSQDTDIKTTTLRELGFSSNISVALIRHRAIVHDESSNLSFDRSLIGGTGSAHYMTWGVTYGMVHRLDRLTLRGSQVAQVCVLVGNETPIRSVAVIVQGFTSGVLLWAPCSHLILRTLAQRSFVVGS